MSEPLTVSTGVLVSGGVGAAGASFATLFPEATPGVMACALAGTALYVVTSENHAIWKQIAFAIISFIGGIYAAGFTSDFLSAVINALLHGSGVVSVPPAIGALVASSIAVTVLLRITRASKTVKAQAK